MEIEKTLTVHELDPATSSGDPTSSAAITRRRLPQPPQLTSLRRSLGDSVTFGSVPAATTDEPSAIPRAHLSATHSYGSNLITRRAPSVSVRAYRNDLRGAIDNGMPKVGLLERVREWRAWKRVLVEGTPLGTKDSVFFAPDNPTTDTYDSRGTPTTFVNIDPRRSPHTVYRGDPFEITFLGMSVSPHDFFSSEENELLLYSLTRGNDILAPGAEPLVTSPASTMTMSAHGTNSSLEGPIEVSDLAANAASQGVPATTSPLQTSPLHSALHPRALSSNGLYGIPSGHQAAALGMAGARALSMNGAPMMSSQNFAVPTGISSVTSDAPFIHYDPVIDGHDVGNAPDAYVPVPATKALYLRCVGKKGTAADDMIPQSVSIRFTIMEIDKVSDVQARAISGVDQLGNYVSPGAESVPYLELLTRAFAVASSLGKSGLKRYEKPDHVHSVDMEFLLADRENSNRKSEEEPVFGNYLQVWMIAFLYFFVVTFSIGKHTNTNTLPYFFPFYI